MSLIYIIIVLAIVGLIIWAVGQLPIDPAFQRIIRVVAIVVVALWLISVLFGVDLGAVRVGR